VTQRPIHLPHTHPDQAFRWRGTWTSGTPYAVGDIVTVGGSVWRANVASSDSAFTSSRWDVLALSPQGDPGDAGAPGADATHLDLLEQAGKRLEDEATYAGMGGPYELVSEGVGMPPPAYRGINPAHAQTVSGQQLAHGPALTTSNNYARLGETVVVEVSQGSTPPVAVGVGALRPQGRACCHFRRAPGAVQALLATQWPAGVAGVWYVDDVVGGTTTAFELLDADLGFDVIAAAGLSETRRALIVDELRKTQIAARDAARLAGFHLEVQSEVDGSGGDRGVGSLPAWRNVRTDTDSPMSTGQVGYNGLVQVGARHGGVWTLSDARVIVHEFGHIVDFTWNMGSAPTSTLSRAVTVDGVTETVSRLSAHSKWAALYARLVASGSSLAYQKVNVMECFAEHYYAEQVSTGFQQSLCNNDETLRADVRAFLSAVGLARGQYPSG
jgi:hypothetical protein